MIKKMNAVPLRGRRPVIDKKKPIRIWLTSAEIEERGGENVLKDKIVKFLKL